jgi:hypothetical protein
MLNFNAATGSWEAVEDGKWITVPKNKIADGNVPAELASAVIGREKIGCE